MKETAYLAGGCFWCLQEKFDNLKGVLETEVGYSGGKLKNPTYDKVSSGLTGYVETLKVVFDPEITSYEEILTEFLSLIEPTNEFGQFCDMGSQYKPKIFYTDEKQKRIAQRMLSILEKSDTFQAPIKVKIEKFKNFFPAEPYHQSYYKKQPKLYRYYLEISGRIYHYKNIAPKIKEFLKKQKAGKSRL